MNSKMKNLFLILALLLFTNSLFLKNQNTLNSILRDQDPKVVKTEPVTQNENSDEDDGYNLGTDDDPVEEVYSQEHIKALQENLKKVEEQSEGEDYSDYDEHESEHNEHDDSKKENDSGNKKENKSNKN